MLIASGKILQLAKFSPISPTAQRPWQLNLFLNLKMKLEAAAFCNEYSICSFFLLISSSYKRFLELKQQGNWMLPIKTLNYLINNIQIHLKSTGTVHKSPTLKVKSLSFFISNRYTNVTGIQMFKKKKQSY
jgi:hypothetical protein